MNQARVLVVAVALGATLGVVPTIAGRHPVPHTPSITPQLQAQVQAAARTRHAYLDSGSPHGPVIVAGMGGVDSGVMVEGRYVQLEYLDCIGDPAARWYEDGSATC